MTGISDVFANYQVQPISQSTPVRQGGVSPQGQPHFNPLSAGQNQARMGPVPTPGPMNGGLGGQNAMNYMNAYAPPTTTANYGLGSYAPALNATPNTQAGGAPFSQGSPGGGPQMGAGFQPPQAMMQPPSPLNQQQLQALQQHAQLQQPQLMLNGTMPPQGMAQGGLYADGGEVPRPTNPAGLAGLMAQYYQGLQRTGAGGVSRDATDPRLHPQYQVPPPAPQQPQPQGIAALPNGLGGYAKGGLAEFAVSQPAKPRGHVPISANGSPGLAKGAGNGTSDSIHAPKLSNGEFVHTAKAVQGAGKLATGKPNTMAGARMMYSLMRGLEGIATH